MIWLWQYIHQTLKSVLLYRFTSVQSALRCSAICNTHLAIGDSSSQTNVVTETMYHAKHENLKFALLYMNWNIHFMDLLPPQAIFSWKFFTPCLFYQGTTVLINQGVQQTWHCLKNACSVNMLLSITENSSMPWSFEVLHTISHAMKRHSGVAWKKISPLYSASISGSTLEPGRDYCLWLLFIKFIAGLLFSLKNAISPLPFLPDCFISWETLEQFTCLLGHARNFLSSWATG